MEHVSRIFLIFCFLLISLKAQNHPSQGSPKSIHAGDFDLFEENGKVGLKNSEGQILIPAQFDAMGWSNGAFSLVNNVTGYRINGKWGLINIQNNRITKADFEDISPGEGSLIVVRKKIPGSVRIRTGCIHTSGKEIIPFQYDGIRITSFRAIVYVRNGTRFRHGLIDLENKLLIPLEYRNIYPLGSLRYGVENFENKTAIFSEDGKQITQFLIDSLTAFKNDYAILYQNQRQGLINREGVVKLEPIYREITLKEDGSIQARQPDGWLWLTGENKLERQFNADSVVSIDENLLKVKLGEYYQLTDKTFKPVNGNTYSFIGPFSKHKAIFKYGNKTGLLNDKGEILIKPVYQSLIPDQRFIRVSQPAGTKNKWTLLDSAGRALTTKNYEYIGRFNGKFFQALHRGYWGAVDENGKEIIACVHDSVLQQKSNYVVVKFRGQYGIINLKEEWMVTPQNNRLQLVNDQRYLELAPQTAFVRSFDGQIIYFSSNPLEVYEDHFTEHTRTGAVWNIDMNGRIMEQSMPAPVDVEKIFPEREGLRAIKRDGRYGFIDNRGRLRIANRYEDVKDFSETLAAAKIRGKWGFIDHEDKIAVQPVYDEVMSFQQGFALVRQKNHWGLLSKDRKLILPVRYDSIIVLSDNRFKTCQNGLWGLADGSGRTFVNPKYDHVTDLKNGYIIVERNGKFGLLTVQGLSTIPEIYDGLTYDAPNNLYMALKKAPWEEINPPAAGR